MDRAPLERPRPWPTPLGGADVADPTTVRCLVCPTEFPAELARMGKRYCTDRCKQTAKRRKRGVPVLEGRSSPLNWAECAWCSAWYVKRLAKITCSPECRAARKQQQWLTRPDREAILAAKRRRYRETFVPVEVTNPVVDHECIECGSSFTTNRYSARRRFCSKACARRAAHRTRKHLERTAARDGEHFTVREIAERDGWTCHLCRRRIPARAEWSNQDDDPTIDHLTPLSAGGTHVRANVAIAHRICNSRRGARGLAQLRLVG